MHGLCADSSVALLKRTKNPRYGRLKMEFYDMLDSLTVAGLPLKPPTSQCAYQIERVRGIVILVDFRGKIFVKHKNKSMRYVFQSEKDIGQALYAAALDMDPK